MKTHRILSVFVATGLLLSIAACNQSASTPDAGLETPASDVATNEKNDGVIIEPSKGTSLEGGTGDGGTGEAGGTTGEGGDGTTTTGDMPLYKFYVEQPSLPPSAYKAMQDLMSDEDGDGVIEAKDACPGTQKGWIVDEKGCAFVLSLQPKKDIYLNPGVLGLLDGGDEPKKTGKAPMIESHPQLNGYLFMYCKPDIWFRFYEPVDPESLAGRVLLINKLTHDVVPTTIELDAEKKKVSLKLSVPLSHGETYTVKISPGIRSAEGVESKFDFDWSFLFQTNPNFDIQCP